jgi:hypothetical protein
MMHIKKNLSYFIAIFIGLNFILFQFYFLFHYLDIDVANYYTQILKKDFFHPHHLLYNFLGYIWLTINDNLNINSFLLLKIMNIIFGGVASFFLYILFFNESKKYILSLLFVFYIILSFDYIFYSQINDTAFMPLFWNIVFITYFFKIKNLRFTDLLFLSLLHTISIGFHQTNLFLIFPSIVKILTSNQKNKIRYLLFYLFFTFFFIAILYVIIGHYILGYSFEDNIKKPIPGIPTGGNFYDWVFMYGHWDKELNWGTLERKNLLLDSLYTFSNALFFHKIYYIKISIEAYNNFLVNQSALMTLEQFLFITFILLLLSHIIFSFYFTKKNSNILGIFLWFIFQSLLIMWWEPTNKEFWLTPLFCFILIQFLNFKEFLELIKAKWIYSIIYYIINYLLFLWIFLIFVNNYKNFLKPSQYKTFFGHWEDLYDYEYFKNIMNTDLKLTFELKQNKETLLKQKLNQLDELRKKLSKKENEIYFKYYIKQFENILISMEKMMYDDNNENLITKEEIQNLKQELELIKNHYDDWLTHYKSH